MKEMSNDTLQHQQQMKYIFFSLLPQLFLLFMWNCFDSHQIGNWSWNEDKSQDEECDFYLFCMRPYWKVFWKIETNVKTKI